MVISLFEESLEKVEQHDGSQVSIDEFAKTSELLKKFDAILKKFVVKYVHRSDFYESFSIRIAKLNANICLLRKKISISQSVEGALK